MEHLLRRGGIDLTGDETGPDFIARIEAQSGKRLPTLILTGATDAETLAELISSGRPWLTKPADPDAITDPTDPTVLAP